MHAQGVMQIHPLVHLLHNAGFFPPRAAVRHPECQKNPPMASPRGDRSQKSGVAQYFQPTLAPKNCGLIGNVRDEFEQKVIEQKVFFVS